MAVIPLEPNKRPNIFSYGYGSTFNRAIDSLSTSVVYDPISKALNTGQVVAGGSLNLKSLSVGGVVKQVSPGDDIQKAIDDIHREGGGEVRFRSGNYLQFDSLHLRSGVSLVGSSASNTVINFQGNAIGIVGTWDGVNEIEGVAIRGITVSQSAATGAIIMNGIQFFDISDVFIVNCTNDGLRVLGCQFGSFRNVVSDGNGGDGIVIEDTTTHALQSINLISVTSRNNTGKGFDITEQNDTLREIQLFGCRAIDNGDDGFSVVLTSGTAAVESQFVGCSSEGNGVNGYEVDVTDCAFIGCQADENTSNGFIVTDRYNAFVACSGVNNGTDFNISEGGSYVGCLMDSITFDTGEDDPYQSSVNMKETVNTFRRSQIFVNNAGTTLSIGQVVVYAPTVSDFKQATTTTAASDNRVVGIVSGAASVSVDASFEVLMEGRTEYLKVDGTTDIAIGDFLTTFTTAGVARKAATGEIAFARALEAYAANDSNGVISAILIPPQQLA